MASSRHNGKKNMGGPAAAASSITSAYPSASSMPAGAAALGVFESYGTGRPVTKAGFLASKGLSTEVFVRFSTVLGSRARPTPSGTRVGSR